MKSQIARGQGVNGVRWELANQLTIKLEILWVQRFNSGLVFGVVLIKRERWLSISFY